MIFTLLCIKEFVKNFPFVNKNTTEDTEKDPIKDTKKESIEESTEGHT